MPKAKDVTYVTAYRASQRRLPLANREGVVETLFPPIHADFYSRGIDKQVEMLNQQVDRLNSLMKCVIRAVPEEQLKEILEDQGFKVHEEDNS